jgi:putative colanic acid biosynthesis UDP-glucose lipid carrier transferase
MNTKFVKNLKLTLLLIDALLINITFFSFILFFQPDILSKSEIQNVNLAVILNLAWFASSISCTIYNEKHILSASSLLNCSVWSWSLCLLIFAFTVLYFSYPIIPYSVIGGGLLLIYITLFVNRIITYFVCNFYRKRYFNSNKVLIVGYNNLSVQLAEQLEADDINKKIIGYCEEEPNVHELSKHPILGNIQHAMDICDKYGATEIYSTVTPDENNYIGKLIQVAEQNCVRFRIVPNLGMYLNKHTEVHYIHQIPIISQHKEPLQNVNNRIIKRAFDIFFSLLVICLINSWLIPLIALLIWIESRGKVMFLQKRSGENNIPFNIQKFRSMYVNENSHSVQAEKNDSRITKVGKFLRRTSLDEFPQFFNVLMGDMSIVGPRPHMLKHTDEYSKLIEKYMVRQFIKPGITGWAQVNGYRGETKNIRQMQKRIEYDIWYVENWSLKTDLTIIFKTVYNVLKGEENAY